LPTQYTDIDAEEIQYIDGGYKVGTYSANDNGGANYLAGEANYYFACCGICVGNGILSAVAAGLASPSVIGGVVL
jgi:hypothetical protein